MVTVGPALGIVICAMLALRAAHLLLGVLWLAASSALLAVFLYLFGAREIAVIELSVGAGLVTVLMVLALNLAGEISPEPHALVPRPLALGLIVLLVVFLFWLSYPVNSNISVAPSFTEASFAVTLWQQRSLDILVQVALIFAGMVGVLGLLAESRLAQPAPSEEQTAPETPQLTEAPPVPEPEWPELEEFTV